MKDYRAAYKAFMKCYPFTLADIDGEEWRNIEDANDYQISNYGRVKSFKPGKIRILKPAFHTGGYIVVTLWIKGQPKKTFTHRLVAKAFIANPERKPEINHIDGCKLNNHFENLEWVTSSENKQHAFSKGLNHAAEGENSGKAKIKNKDAEYIRDNPDNLSIQELAKKFNVSYPVIIEIQLGQSYKQAGGKRRVKKWLPVSTDTRNEIRRLFVKGDKNFGVRPLARKFNISTATILRILKGK